MEFHGRHDPVKLLHKIS